MKVLLVSLVMSFGAMVHADVSQVFGRWISPAPVFSQNGMNIYLGMEFKDAHASVMSTICEFIGGKRIEAVVSVPVQITEGQIQTLSAGQNEVSDGGQRCNVSVVPGTVQFQVLGVNALQLISSGNVLQMIRRQ